MLGIEHLKNSCSRTGNMVFSLAKEMDNFYQIPSSIYLLQGSASHLLLSNLENEPLAMVFFVCLLKCV